MHGVFCVACYGQYVCGVVVVLLIGVLLRVCGCVCFMFVCAVSLFLFDVV